jgi:hypothetical protein
MIREILSQRDYNKKVFNLDGGNMLYRCFASHKHYKDNNDFFQDIDSRLVFNDIEKKWKHNKASYYPSIPEYVDDWFEFYNAYEGTKHVIKAKPIAFHIKGEYFEDKEGNYVLYKESFGKGVDLKVYSYWAGLKKVICINNKPLDVSKDLIFDFELELPQGSEISDKLNIEWNKISSNDFTSKTIKIGKDGKYSYFRNAILWDSEDLIQPVNIELYIKDGKTYLRKTISKEILDKVVYPLYTDHPTSYYSGAGDGYVQGADPDWNTAHDLLTGTLVDYTAITMQARSANQQVRKISRIFIPINTNGISGTIVSATINLYITSVSDTNNDGYDYLNIVQTSQPDTTQLTTADFDLCGSVNNPTLGAISIDLGNISALAYKIWTLNSTGIGWIDINGTSMFGMREGHDISDQDVGLYNDGVAISTSEDTSGTKDPYLEITISGYGQLMMVG